MAFQTGTASSFINLLDALRLFATANGWTQNNWSAVGADQWLSLQKGSIYANLLASTARIQMKGALGYSGASAWNAQPSTHTPSPGMSDGWYGAVNWPVTYWFFQHAAPDSIEVVIRYQPTRHLWLQFGTITQYGTWPGGEFFAGSIDRYDRGLQGDYSTQIGGPVLAALFWRTNAQYLGSADNNSMLHVAVDSKVWATSQRAPTGTEDGDFGYLRASASDHAYPLPQRSNSAFNGLTTLQPIELYVRRPDDHHSPLGRVEHVRYAIVTNHNAADIIDIGGQKWMLFPWVEKGGPTDAGGQHYGMAIKYDGP